MSETNNKSLLPPNATKLLRDLEIVSNRAFNLETLNRFVNNPNQALENILPWLAWAVSVDDWSDSWSVEVKRKIIKASVEIHKKKGTIGALRRALEAFNYSNIKVEEWFEYGGDPHFFRVFFDITKAGFDVNILSQIQRVINNTKNARSHLESLKAFLVTEINSLTLGSVIISKEITTIYPIT